MHTREVHVYSRLLPCLCFSKVNTSNVSTAGGVDVFSTVARTANGIAARETITIDDSDSDSGVNYEESKNDTYTNTSSSAVACTASSIGSEISPFISQLRALGIKAPNPKSAKWFWYWVRKRLSIGQCRLIIAGLHRADGSFACGYNKIWSSSVTFRDELCAVLLHAGYTVRFTLEYPKGSIRGYMKIDRLPSDEKVIFSQVDILGRESEFVPLRAPRDNWCIFYSEPTSSSGKGLAYPSLFRSQCELQRYTGRIWCVQVNHPDHLIIVQRANRNNVGEVDMASRPIIVGNCGGLGHSVLNCPKLKALNASKAKNSYGYDNIEENI